MRERENRFATSSTTRNDGVSSKPPRFNSAGLNGQKPKNYNNSHQQKSKSEYPALRNFGLSFLQNNIKPFKGFAATSNSVGDEINNSFEGTPDKNEVF